ncbi:MAG: GNAT family N-acetyltransferase [Actinobacteria bacterium]|nr:GNAT family N-acetyltransferase [Actinomycetota bacterium]
MPIRLATTSDIAQIQTIEEEAGKLFRDMGMVQVADEPPPTTASLIDTLEQQHAWVFADDAGATVAFILIASVDGDCHIEQVSVRPSHSRRGIGRELIEHAAGAARAKGQHALTLTTFRDVPWNAPYYERLGFTALAEDEMGPGLALAFARDDRFPEPRVAMRRYIHP